jgi:hypothetical protein
VRRARLGWASSWPEAAAAAGAAAGAEAAEAAAEAAAVAEVAAAAAAAVAAAVGSGEFAASARRASNFGGTSSPSVPRAIPALSPQLERMPAFGRGRLGNLRCAFRSGVPSL